jgi:DNA ligase-1
MIPVSVAKPTQFSFTCKLIYHQKWAQFYSIKYDNLYIDSRVSDIPMDFNQLVEYYERIAATSKRLEIIDILSEAFSSCNDTECKSYFRKIIYLTQGQLVSEIDDAPKFGVAEKMVIQALTKLSAKKPEEIKKIINRRGDVGEAAQELVGSQEKSKVQYSLDAFQVNSNSSKSLSIPKLYEELTKITDAKGGGSQDLKINIINRLLRQCTPIAAKYVINIILSNLRIGIADMSIMDALAIAFTGDKKNREIIESAYNLHPDLGEIAEILINNGFDAVAQIGIQIGIPIKMMLASRVPYQQIPQKLGGGPFVAEYKYDGERTQVHKRGQEVHLFSRRLKEITDQYPDVVNEVQTQVKAENAIFEGEMVAMDPQFTKMLPFQVVSVRRRKYDIQKMSEEVPVCLYCFDVLYLQMTAEEEGQIIMNNPLLERREILNSLIEPSNRIHVAIKRDINSVDEMVEFFKEARANGAEGIMNKAIGPDSVYQAGNRGFLWIKLKGLEGAKMVDSIDVVIIGGTWGKGRHAGTISTFFGAVVNDETDKFEFLTRIGSGFSDEDLEKFTKFFKEQEIESPGKEILCKDKPDIWVRPELIFEIMGDELTISNKSDAGATEENPNGYSVRFPIFQRVREDKSVNDITTTKEILELYEAQG